MRNTDGSSDNKRGGRQSSHLKGRVVTERSRARIQDGNGRQRTHKRQQRMGVSGPTRRPGPEPGGDGRTNHIDTTRRTTVVFSFQGTRGKRNRRVPDGIAIRDGRSDPKASPDGSDGVRGCRHRGARVRPSERLARWVRETLLWWSWRPRAPQPTGEERPSLVRPLSLQGLPRGAAPTRAAT